MSVKQAVGFALLLAWGWALAARAGEPAVKTGATQGGPGAKAATGKQAGPSTAAKTGAAKPTPAKAAAAKKTLAKPSVPYVPPPPASVVRAPGRVTIQVLVAPPGSSNAPRLDCVASAGPVFPITALAFSPDGRVLAAAGYKEVLIWDVVEGRLLNRLGIGQIHGTVHALVFDPDGNWLAAGGGMPGSSGAVWIFENLGGELVRTCEEPKDVLYALAVSPDGKMLAGGGADKAVYVWNMPDGKLTTTIKDHRDWVQAVLFSPDGKLLASGGADRTAILWEAGAWKSAVKMIEKDVIQAVAFSPDSQLVALAVGGQDDQSIRVRRAVEPPPDPAALKRKEPPRPQIGLVVRTMPLSPAVPLDLFWSPQTDGKMCVPCSDKTLRVFNAKGGQIASLVGHGDWVYCAAVAPDGTKIASGGADGAVKLYSGTDHRPLATFIQLTAGEDDWLIVTPQGYFAASAPELVAWETANLKTERPKLAELLAKPEAVRDQLAGKRVPPPPLK